MAKECLLKMIRAKKFVKNIAYVGTIMTHYRHQHANFVEKTAWKFPCTAGETTAVIDYNGDVRACELLDKFASLSDFDYDFSALWDNEKRQAELKEIDGGKSCWCTHVCFIHDSLRHSRKGFAHGSSEKLFDAGEMGMIRSLFDVENMPEGEEKSDAEKKLADSEAAEKENISEETLGENIVEKPLSENIPETMIDSIVQEDKTIRHLPTDEIISRLNETEEVAQKPLSIKHEEIIQKIPLQEPVSSLESPTFVDEPLEDDSFIELEEAAKKIESEAQLESETKPEISFPINEEFEFEDPKVTRLESELAEIENELLVEKEAEENLKAEKAPETKRKSSVVNSIFDDAEETPVSETKASQTTPFLGETETTDYIKSEDSSFIIDAKPESKVETFRKSGMAYSAAIILLGAVVFMMILGWGADLLFGTSPWGIVVGIVLGSIIGFIQFFRVTSEIFKQ